VSPTKSVLLIEKLLKKQLEIEGLKITRRNRPMNELISATVMIDHHEIEQFNNYRQGEYNHYRQMIQGQIIRFDNYLNLDRFSRRLLIQFPADWYDYKPEDYMPCPESFAIFYSDENLYNLVINFRSTELSRASEDISIIKALCEKELVMPGRMNNIFIHFMNVHEYLDKGSSEDFDVTNGYFNRKTK